MLMESSIECGSVDDMLGRLGAARKAKKYTNCLHGAMDDYA